MPPGWVVLPLVSVATLVSGAILASMDQRVSFITLAVPDLAAERRFYVEGLRWAPELDVDDVLMFRVGERLVLSLWDEREFEAEVGPVRRGVGLAPVTLAHNCPTPAGVDEVLDRARAAGADVSTATRREWGGYSGYFADPAGFRWEVAYNPGDIGRLVMPDTH